MTLSVSQLLDLPVLSNARVCAGAKFLGRPVRSLNVLEILLESDGDLWLPDHLILSTLSFTGGDEEQLNKVIRVLARIGCAGVILQLGVIGPLEPSVLRTADAVGLPLIQLPPDQLYHTIIASIVGALLQDQSATERYAARVRGRFSESIADGASIDGLLNSLAEEVGRAVALVSEWSGLVAASSNRSTSGECLEPCLVGIAAGPTSLPGCFEVIGRGVAESAWLLIGDVSDKRALTGLQRAAVEESLPFVRIWIYAQRRNAQARRKQLQELFASVIGNREDAHTSLRQVQSLGYDIACSSCAILIQPQVPQGLLAADGRRELEILDIAAIIVTALLPHAFVVPYAGMLAVVLAIPRGAEHVARQRAFEMLEKIRVPLIQMQWRCAIGSVVAAFEETGRSVELARTALKIRSSYAEVPSVVTYNDVAADAVLLELSSRPEIRQWALALLGPLKTEHESSSDLIMTLNVFFESAHSHKVAAGKLGIHPKSLKYRLDRIVTLLGVDPFKPEHQFSYNLAARITLLGQ